LQTNDLLSQLKELNSFSSQHPSLPVLKDLIRELRDDELDHLDVAIENDSQRAPAHALLSSVIVTGCKVAIELCRKV
jgi:ubiquinone biosynthesis monooxygenase Coq7